MGRKITIRGTKREKVDTEKLAIAFLMLARILDEQRKATEASSNQAARKSEAT